MIIFQESVMSNINVTKTHLPNIKKYIQYIERIYQSGWLTNGGACVQELTKRLEQYLGVKNLVLVSNATLGLQLAYKALGLSGEVITTPFSFVATTSSLVWEKLTPKFVDIDPASFCMGTALIEAVITSKTSAILPVHVYGNACEVEKIEAIAQKHKLKLVYDAAHAFDVKYKEQSLLNYGDVSVLSFHATKLFHTVEGGALIIKDDVVYEKVKKLMNFGLNGPLQIVSEGINTKMSEFHAAMGLCVLDDMQDILAKRQKVDGYYRMNLPVQLRLLEVNKAATPNYAYFPVVFESEAQLLNVEAALKANNIVPRRYFYPSLNKVPYVEYQRMPVSEDIAPRVLCLPMYAELNQQDLDRIISVIKTVVAS
jgi:dTDP-4-amino-4,6-dideoxygalactose transaminase